jgi:hypothetical protein
MEPVSQANTTIQHASRNVDNTMPQARLDITPLASGLMNSTDTEIDLACEDV